MLLLDTNVLSELRKVALHRADPKVAAWASQANPDHFHLSVISLQEIMVGILRRERTDPKQAEVYRRWLVDQVIPAFAGRIQPVDERVALRCAALHVPDPRPHLDAIIAATALVHSFTVVTRNVADFRPMGVPVVDPWD